MVGCHTRSRQVRQEEHCYTHFPLDATSDITFPLVSSDAARNTITPSNLPLIHSASRYHPYGFPASSHTLKVGTLGKMIGW